MVQPSTVSEVVVVYWGQGRTRVGVTVDWDHLRVVYKIQAAGTYAERIRKDEDLGLARPYVVRNSP